ncbi:MAG: aldehyde ferredoxin oxidoreductase C-terminal domain-containing protein, partial [Clostridia bacterium]
ILREVHGKRTSVSCIGISGENKSFIACIMNDGKDARAAGRCGVGAVMGSKNLKAISVNGDIPTPVANEAEFNASVKKWAPLVFTRMAGLREGGTSGAVPMIEEIGDLPINNWRDGNFKTENIDTKTYNSKFLSGRYSCAGCSIRCGRVVTIEDGPYKCKDEAGPEYETLALFGPNCMIDDLGAISHANKLCNMYGMDTIGCANSVSFIMEAFEHGIVTEEMLGMKARFGNCDDMIEIVHRMARSENEIFAALADGSRVCAALLGQNSIEFSVQVRGLDFPAHDPRYSNSVALQYATSPRGACHLATNTHGMEYGGSYHGFGFREEGIVELDNHSNDEKVDMNIQMEKVMCLCDSMTCCKFLLDATGEETGELFVNWLSWITGWDLTVDELNETGERIFNLKRMYLVRDGQTRKDDKLPPRMKKRRMTGGSATNIPHLDGMLDEYYEKHGWDEFGVPTKETLARLDLL